MRVFKGEVVGLTVETSQRLGGNDCLNAENLPVADSEVDVVISNGVINLTTDKGRAFAEIFRVLKPGGRLLLADIVVREEMSLETRSDIDLWTS